MRKGEEQRKNFNCNRRKGGTKRTIILTEKLQFRRMKINQLPLLACFVVYTVLHFVSADQGTFYDALREELPPKARDNGPHDGNQMGIGLERDGELFEVAYRFIKQLTETRKSLAALKDVLGYLDEDLKQKSEMLEERYVKGKDLWNLLKEAVQSETAQEKIERVTKENVSGEPRRTLPNGECSIPGQSNALSQLWPLTGKTTSA